MRIAVSAKQLEMPPLCACCGRPSATTFPVSATRVEGKRVIRTKTATWHFPACASCAGHDREWPGASAVEVFVFTLLTCGLYLYFYAKRRQRALAMCWPTCARPRQAVSYLGWHGTAHQFEIASEAFARAFMTSNERKVVGADAVAREVMSRPVAPPVPAVVAPRSAPARVQPVATVRASAPPNQIVASARTAERPQVPPRPSQTAQSISVSDGFYGPHQSVTVAARQLHGPLAYVVRDQRHADASAIVPSLSVGNGDGAQPLPYWPSYTTAWPEQRAVYLDWLAGGRSDPAVPIGYVFIHFYGLERRALVDGLDHDVVHAELVRLLAIYGDLSRSFRGYASSLMAFMTLPGLGTLSEYTMHARIGQIAEDNATALAGVLAWFHLHGRPLPSAGAMLVAGSMEEAKRGTVVKRARAELNDLFAIRYGERFGDGIKLDAAKRPQAIPYHPGSPSLVSAARQAEIKIPHVLGKPSQFGPLVALWNECIADLKKLSFARRDEGASSPLTRDAWMALPPELRADYEHPDQDAWDDAIQAAPRVGTFRVIAAGRLAALAGIEVDERVTGARLRKAVEAAAALGYAVEPDARVATKTVPVSTELAIWRSTATDPPDAALWKSVHTMLALTLSVALADGDLAQEEGRTVDGLIEDLFALDDSMRTRVAALRAMLTRQPGRATTVAKKLKESRSPEDLAKIGRVLVAVAAVDGVIVEGEHKSLKALYKAMGLSPAELAAAIVGSGARLASDKTVQAQAARPGVAGEAIPPPPGSPASALHGPSIASILAETREVALLLSEVLDDDDDDEDDAKPPKPVAPRSLAVTVTPGNGAWSSLDPRYHDVLRELLTHASWSLPDVRAIATRAKMMPGAILEAVNSWSDEHFGDYLIEEAGDWRINAQLLERAKA